MSVSKSVVFETRYFICRKDPPPYQLDAIEWLKDYRHTEPLQDLLRQFRFSETEVRAYREKWAQWLKPKEATARRMRGG